MDIFLKKLAVLFFDFFQTIIVSLAIFVVLYQVAAQPHRVQGASMELNFLDGEFILTEKLSYRFTPPQRGDVVVFHFTKTKPEVDYIKRIIGLPGDEIALREGVIYVNNIRLSEPYLLPGQKTQGHSFLQERQGRVIPAGEYFVLGDNRNRSSDSREWGTIKRREIVGRAFLRYWPVSSFGLVTQAATHF